MNILRFGTWLHPRVWVGPDCGSRFLALCVVVSVSLFLSVTGASRSDLTGAVERIPIEEKPLLESAGFASGEMSYLAFPALLRVNDSDVLIAYKRGNAHARDPGAKLEIVCYDTERMEITRREVLAEDEERIYQMGEWIAFPNGEFGLFADVQKVVRDHGQDRHHRTGAEWFKSDDGGVTFDAMGRMDPVDGVQYGYVFEGIATEGRTYMLAMSFPETESGSFFDEDGNRVYGEVSVLVSVDDGDSWEHVRTLSREFGGININESSFLECDDGYLVATRGYDGRVRLHRTDGEFRLLQQRDLTAEYGFIPGLIGRPRLFSRDGEVYLLGRNYPDGRPIELALFRIDPESLGVLQYLILDNAEGRVVRDAYYAVPYFDATGMGGVLNVITYRGWDQSEPDLVHLRVPWGPIGAVPEHRAAVTRLSVHEANVIAFQSREGADYRIETTEGGTAEWWEQSSYSGTGELIRSVVPAGNGKDYRVLEAVESEWSEPSGESVLVYDPEELVLPYAASPAWGAGPWERFSDKDSFVGKDESSGANILFMESTANAHPNYTLDHGIGEGTAEDRITVDFRFRLFDADREGTQFRLGIWRPDRDGGASIRFMFEVSLEEVRFAGGPAVAYPVGTEWHDVRLTVDVAERDARLFMNNGIVPLIRFEGSGGQPADRNFIMFGQVGSEVYGSVGLAGLRLIDDELLIPEASWHPVAFATEPAIELQMCPRAGGFYRLVESADLETWKKREVAFIDFGPFSMHEHQGFFWNPGSKIRIWKDTAEGGQAFFRFYELE